MFDSLTVRPCRPERTVQCALDRQTFVEKGNEIARFPQRDAVGFLPVTLFDSGYEIFHLPFLRRE